MRSGKCWDPKKCNSQTLGELDQVQKLMSCLKISNESKDKSLPIMYWIPELHKSPVGSRFIITSKNCSTKPLPKVVSNVFKLIHSQIE